MSTTEAYEEYELYSDDGDALIRLYAKFVLDHTANTSKCTIRSIGFYCYRYSYYNWFDIFGSVSVAGETIISYDGTGDARFQQSNRDGQHMVTAYSLPVSAIIKHDSTGSANIEIKLLKNGESYFITKVEGKPNDDLVWSSNAYLRAAVPQIDRTAPPITVSVKALSDTSIKISATSNYVSCTNWQYNIDNTGWLSFGTGSTDYTSAECEVNRLSAGRHVVAVRATKELNNIVGTSSNVVIDTSLPTITVRLSEPTYNSLLLTAYGNVTCYSWEYSLDNGETWTLFDSDKKTSASTTITGLSPNTTYSVIARAKKDSNDLYGVSEAKSGTTNGGSVLTRVNSSAIDVASPSITFYVNVKETLYHKLKIYKSDGTTLVSTITIGSLEIGTSKSFAVSVTSAIRTALLNCFPNAKTYAFRVSLESFSDSGYTTSLGESGPVSWTATTSADVSKPTFTNFTYKDTDAETTDMTGDDQVLIQNASHLIVYAVAGTAKNGATVSGYSVSIGDVSMTGASTTLDAGAVSVSGDLTLRVSCIDSRGYSTSVEKTVKVLPYSKPRFTMFNLRRRNEIEDLVQLYFNGAVSSIVVDDAEKNSVVSVSFKYKLSSAPDSEYVTVDLTNVEDMTITGLAFSFSCSELFELDNMSSYRFVFYVYDELGDTTVLEYSVLLSQGTPLLSFRKKTNTLPPRVGINKPAPVYPLDVNGDIAMRGPRVLGYGGELSTHTLTSSTFRKGGYFSQLDDAEATSARGYPVEAAGFLEVICTNTGKTIQRYTPIDIVAHPYVYIRAYNGEAWTAWKKLTLS